MFQVGGGADTANVGLNINWESNERPIAATIGSGKAKPVFDIAFKGKLNISGHSSTKFEQAFFAKNDSSVGLN